MAGVVVEGGRVGGRKAVDSEINMIPMIDLLMVTVSFLLITAVWSHMARLTADTKVPGDATATRCTAPSCAPEKELHVDMRSPDRFVLSWRDGSTVLTVVDVPRHGPRFDSLASAVAHEWEAAAVHRAPSDRATNRAVLHTADDTRYEEMIAAMDAIYGVKRPLDFAGTKSASTPAFHVALATN